MAALTGPERVATLLLSLDKEASAALLRHIGPEVLTEVAEAMTRIDPQVSTHECAIDLQRLLAVEATGPGPVQPKKDDELGQLLDDGIGPAQSREVVEQLRERRMNERPFLELEARPPDEVARALEDESPAVCALVLAHLEPSMSATILSLLDSDKALGIVKRMAALKPPGIAMLRSICESVVEGIAELASGPVVSDPEDRLKTIATMLNFSNTEVEQKVLTGLSEDDEETAQVIREHMFAWDDLSTIDKRSMQKILGLGRHPHPVDRPQGLQASDIEDNVTGEPQFPCASDMVVEERDLAGAMPLTEVLAARNQVMTTVRGMIESGEFSPARSGEELVT